MLERSIKILSKVLTALVVTVLILIFSYGLYGILDVDAVYEEADAEHFAMYRPIRAAGEEQAHEDFAAFDTLCKQNPEIIAWIDLYGTRVHYPIVHAADNEKYLDTDIFGGYSAAGSIFLDCRNTGTFKETNNILYGHHMAQRAMFGDIGKYADAHFFDTHEYGNLYANRRHYGLHILAYIKTHGADSVLYNTEFSKADDLKRFIEHTKAHAVFSRLQSADFGSTDTENANYLLLSTCTTETEGRQLLLCRIMPQTFADPFEQDGEQQLIRRGNQQAAAALTIRSKHLILMLALLLFLLSLIFYLVSKGFRKNRSCS